MLAQRIRKALDILGHDQQVRGTLRQQASTYIGEQVDDRALMYMHTTADTVYEHTVRSAAKLDITEDEAKSAALAMVMVAGLAIGKRLGIEDGEAFARQIPDLEEPA